MCHARLGKTKVFYWWWRQKLPDASVWRELLKFSQNPIVYPSAFLNKSLSALKRKQCRDVIIVYFIKL